MFGFPWNVIVGESFDFDIEYDHEFCYYFFYGPIAVLAYKVNHMNYLQDIFSITKALNLRISHHNKHILLYFQNSVEVFYHVR